MGSRSKQAVGRRATSPGRQFTKPKKPLVIRFEDAFWDVLRELRTAKAKGETRVFTKSTPKYYGARVAGPRAERRAATRALARSMFSTANVSVPRAERRRAAFTQAREALAPKQEVQA